MTDNAVVDEERKREVAKERRRRRLRGRGLVAKGEAENTVVFLSTSNSLYSLVRSLARQQHHHKTSLSSGNFSGIVTVNNVHLTFSFSLPHIVNPPHRSLFQS